MIHILNINLKFKVSIIGKLSIDISDLSTVPHAIIFAGQLYVISNAFSGSVHYVLRNCSISDYITFLMDSFPYNSYYIVYV